MSSGNEACAIPKSAEKVYDERFGQRKKIAEAFEETDLIFNQNGFDTSKLEVREVLYWGIMKGYKVNNEKTHKQGDSLPPIWRDFVDVGMPYLNTGLEALRKLGYLGIK